MVDSTATHSFMSQAAVDHLKLKAKPHRRQWVTIVDRKSFQSEIVVSIELFLKTSVGNGSL